jgi:hypothetical protein
MCTVVRHSWLRRCGYQTELPLILSLVTSTCRSVFSRSERDENKGYREVRDENKGCRGESLNLLRDKTDLLCFVSRTGSKPSTERFEAAGPRNRFDSAFIRFFPWPFFLILESPPLPTVCEKIDGRNGRAGGRIESRPPWSSTERPSQSHIYDQSRVADR